MDAEIADGESAWEDLFSVAGIAPGTAAVTAWEDFVFGRATVVLTAPDAGSAGD